jgi:hypothetical protein
MPNVALNYDLIVDILEYVHPPMPNYLHLCERDWANDARRVGFYTTLAGFCLVSRLWLIPGRGALYRVIPDLTMNPRPLGAFLRTVREVPEIRPIVRWIHLLTKMISALTAANLADLNLLPRCVLIVPSTYWQHSRTSLAIIPALEALGHVSLERPGWTSDTWMSAFRCWSRLEKLRISSSSINFPSSKELADDDGSPQHLLPSLRTLRLDGLRDVWPVPPLTPNTINTLMLSDSKNLPEPPFFDLLQQHSVSLRCLYVHGPMFLDYDSPVFDNVGLYAPNLTHLCVRTVYGNVTGRILSQLPLSLVNLEISFYRPIPPTTCLSLIKQRAATLKCIQIYLINTPVFEVEAKKDDWLPVLHVAETSGIQFLVEWVKPSQGHGGRDSWVLGNAPEREHLPWTQF